MASFPLCPACRAEYGDPADRRFHAEPNACPACGPSLSVRTRTGDAIATDDPIGCAAESILSGEIVAVRGLGGFHLAADATNDAAVGALRERKNREEKPFAVMVGGLESARRIASLRKADEAILSSPCAPILLLAESKRSPISPSVAPGRP